MDVCPEKSYKLPKYPDMLHYDSESSKDQYPKLSAEALLIVISMLVAQGRSESVKTDSATQLVEDSNQNKSQQKEGKRQVKSETAIFEHGNGRGSVGCVMVAPPVFISEEDARNLIIEMLGKQGVVFDEKDKVIREIQFKSIEWIRDGSKSKMVEKMKPLAIDLFSSAHNIGIEYVSTSDYYQLGGEVSNSSIQSFNVKEIAGKLSKKLTRENRIGAVFYDPCVKFDRAVIDEYMKLQNEIHAIENETSQLTEEQEGKIKEIQKSIDEITEQQQKKAEDLLRAQVNDFISWLQEKEMIKN